MVRLLPVFVAVLFLVQALCVVPLGTDASAAGRSSLGPKLVDTQNLDHMFAWANDTSASDQGHVFYIIGNELRWWDTAKNTTSLLRTVTYNLTGCPSCPAEPSELVKVGASTLENGSYHVVLLERQPKNNATAQYMIAIILGTDGSKIYEQRAKTMNVTKFVVERNLIAFVRVYPDGVNKSLEFMFWQGTGYYLSDTPQNPGSTDVIGLALAYTKFNHYVVTFATPTCKGVNTMITDNGQGFSEFGCYIKEIGDDWTIERMDSSGGCIGAVCFYVNAMIERNLVNGSRKVDYWMMQNWSKKVDRVVFQDGPIYQVLPDSPLEVLWDGCFVELAFRLNNESGVAPHPPPEVWINRLGLQGEPIKNDFSSTNTRGSISLIDGDGGFSMTGYAPEAGPMPSLVKFDYDTKVFGNWGVDGLGVFPLNGTMMEGETLNVSFHPFSKVDICPVSCMNGSTAVLLVDGVPVQGQEVQLQSSDELGWLNFTWNAVWGPHNLAVRLEVEADTDFSDNEMSLDVQIDEYPDLVVRDLTASPSVVPPGQDVSFQVRVLNAGGNLTKANLSLYLDGALVWNGTLAKVITGYNATVTGHFNVSNRTVGPHSLKAEAYPVGTVDRDPSDNIAFGTVRVYYRDLVLAITTPRDRQEVSSGLTVQGTIVDPEGFNTTVRAELWRNVLVSSLQMRSINGTFSFSFDLSSLQPSLYTLVVTANGTDNRTATQKLDVLVLNEPYWSVLDPSDGKLLVIDEGSIANITAVAKDGGTGAALPVTWTINGQAATKFQGVSFVGDMLRFGTSYKSAGSYILEASASNRFGNISALWHLEVLDVNRPPVIVDTSVAPGPLTVKANDTLYIAATGADPDGDNLSYVWTFDNETVYGHNLTLRPTKAGNFTLELRVTDGINESKASWTIQVTVPPVVVPPKKPKAKNDGTLTALISILALALVVMIVLFMLVLWKMQRSPKRRKPGRKE